MIPDGYAQLRDDMLVQWHDGSLWHRGRVQTVYQQTVTLAGPRNGLGVDDMVLVKHSCDCGLEFVKGSRLVKCEEKHSDE